MGLVSSAFGPTRAIVRQLLNDKDLRELVTYRLWVSQEFSREVGGNVDTYEETADLKAARLRANAKTVAVLAGNLEAGDVLFMMDAQTLPEGISKKDQIVDANGRIYKIEDIHHVFGIVVAFQVEGAAK
jgi:hypothetical protein